MHGIDIARLVHNRAIQAYDTFSEAQNMYVSTIRSKTMFESLCMQQMRFACVDAASRDIF
jgi:hypothetical protein